MKTIYDFVYSPGKLTPEIVWYSVKVGKNKRDQVANQLLQKISRSSNDCLYAVHNKQMADFQEKVAESFQVGNKPTAEMPFGRLRRVYIEVQELAKIVKSMPLVYLNRPSATWRNPSL